MSARAASPFRRLHRSLRIKQNRTGKGKYYYNSPPTEASNVIGASLHSSPGYFLSFQRSSKEQSLIRQLRWFWNSTTTNDDHDHDHLEVLSTRTGPTISSRAVVLKQRDEDLSKEELALKVALLKHQALLDDPNTLSTDNALKKSLESLRDCLEAVEYWEDALQVEQELELYASSALELAACTYRQGKLFIQMEDAVHANAKYQKALEMFQLEYGNHNSREEDGDEVYHADIGSVIMAMSGVHFANGNIEECLNTLIVAEDHFRKHDTNNINQSTATETATATGRDPRAGLVKCLENQGMMYRIKQDFYAALEKYEEALQLNGDSDFEKRQSLQMHTADMLGAVGDMDGAILYYEKILKEDRQHRGSDEETILDGVILHCIGVFHSQQRKLDLAERELAKAVEIKKRFAGETNIEVGKSLNALGSVHGVVGNKREALECFQQALLIQRMHAEDDNAPEILHILRNISVLKGEKVPKWDG